MAVICPNGHESEWDDYCSVCGVAIAGTAASNQSPTPDPPSPPSAGEGEISCANCGEPASETDVFCENCGYDFLSGSLPDVVETPAEPSASGADRVRVSVDLAFFDRMGFEGVDPPSTIPDPVEVELPPTDILIGRASESRGTFPEIDLHGLFEDASVEDPAVSSSHARLRKSGATWTITDLGSTNGTYVDGADDAIRPGELVPVAPGVVINVGAWTAITLLD